jgi:hypothetical protein
VLLARKTITTEETHVPLLPPKPGPLVSTGLKAPRELLEKLDWIADREQGYSRNDLLIVGAERLVAAYEEENHLTVGRLAREADSEVKRKKK